MPKKKNSKWKTEPNVKKAPQPPCGERHEGQCWLSPNCKLYR